MLVRDRQRRIALPEAHRTRQRRARRATPRSSGRTALATSRITALLRLALKRRAVHDQAAAAPRATPTAVDDVDRCMRRPVLPDRPGRDRTRPGRPTAR